MTAIRIEPLTREAFEPFGDVVEISDSVENYPINGGTTQRYNDLATAIARGEDARVAISACRAQPFELPLELKMVERHPEGSQAFIPMQPCRFVVVVAPDENGTPGQPRAFLAAPGQGVNYFAGTWHGVLTVLDKVSDFAIIDRQGEGPNLEEYFYEQPHRIEP